MADDAPPGAVEACDCVVYRDGSLTPEPRRLVREEPLTIHLGDRPLVTLMRTPGHERELALGYLLTEGLISSTRDVGLIRFCESGAEEGAGELWVELAPGAALRREPDSHRRVYSSCCLCGAEAIDEVARDLTPFPAAEVAPEDLCEVARRLRAGQPLFEATGGTHAAALVELPLSADGPVFVREDLGRHNALDKAVGAGAMSRLAAGSRSYEHGWLLFLSGRLSFEMVAKAARAGLGIVAGVSAPTALGVQLARRLNMFLAGFVRGETLTVYSGAPNVGGSDHVPPQPTAV